MLLECLYSQIPNLVAFTRELELEWANWTSIWEGQDKTNHSEQILSPILKGQWDRLSPEGKLERNLAECLLALAPASLVEAGSGARQRGPSEALLPVCGGTRRDRVSLLPHFKLTLRLWRALNTEDNTGFIAGGWWQTGTNCQATTGSRGSTWCWGSVQDAFFYGNQKKQPHTIH